MSTIHIILNGSDRETPQGSTIRDLIIDLGAGGAGTAVAVNDAIVRRDDYPNVILSPGDRVELIRAVGGG